MSQPTQSEVVTFIVNRLQELSNGLRDLPAPTTEEQLHSRIQSWSNIGHVYALLQLDGTQAEALGVKKARRDPANIPAPTPDNGETTTFPFFTPLTPDQVNRGFGG